MALPLMTRAQIIIGGSVYGGARQADVGGSTFVDIGADNHDVLISYVYGGNDISGQIGKKKSASATVPSELDEAAANHIDNTYDAFVRINPDNPNQTVTTGEGDEAVTTQKYHIFIGNLFGGGNGDYDYESAGSPYKGMAIPELGKTYLEIKGGTICYVYGGGNNATVTDATDICINNYSEVTTAIPTGSTGTANILTDASYLNKMGIPALGENATRATYHFSRVFGGNNFAEMKIMPTWHLKKGNIDNLYSGGNEGDMTYSKGLLLEIQEGSKIMVNNVYGGCRKADVHPKKFDGTDAGEDDIYLADYKFPKGLSARVLVRDGDINNVYGGNDITGKVTGGNAIGVYTSIKGNIYGGGNGSYPYTDNPALKETLLYGDYFYDVKKILGLTTTSFTSAQSVEALNDFRPDAEQVSIRVWGPSETEKTIIGGAIYVGGNSATLKNDDPEHAIVHLKIGSNVIADKVFLGNNGENMVTNDVLQKYAGYVTPNGAVSDAEASGYEDFSQMNLKNETDFASYMEGCAMTLIPSVVFDDEDNGDPDTYDVAHRSYFGSFYCGGNVGSMIMPGKVTINFDNPVVIFDKLVGGCNNAYIPGGDTYDHPYNAPYQGGVIGSLEKTTGDGNKDKLELNLSGLLIEPKRWIDETNKSEGLEWNTWIGNDKNVINPQTAPLGKASDNDLNRRFLGGNIYGGCCESGVVNGNVIINVNSTIMDCEVLFDKVAGDNSSLYGDDLLNQEEYSIEERRTGVILGQQGMDALGMALNLFGGGKGSATEIWGSTTINLNKGYVFQVYGGSENGVIGKSSDTSSSGAYAFQYTPVGAEGTDTKVTRYLTNDDKYSCYVNLKGASPGVSKSVDKTEGYNEDMTECEFIYGGSFEGPIAGNTVVRLGNGRIFNSFAGSCDADILGHTETYVGYDHTYKNASNADIQVHGFPWVRDIVYGGNDVGGKIMGEKTFKNGYVRAETDDMRYNDAMLTASAYMEYRHGHADAIFGGHFGTYDYLSDDSEYKRSSDKIPYLGNAFVNFRPESNSDLRNPNKKNTVNYVYGGSQGYPEDLNSNSMQESSYVLIDIPQDMDNYKDMIVFGAGAWGGLGMKTKVEPVRDPNTEQSAELDKHSAIIDLVRGQLATVYGGSYQEGITRRTVINVPAAPAGRDTLAIGSIFGGAFGTSTYSPCDVYEANVNYRSSTAALTYDPKTNERYTGSIYGGNNNERRTLYGRVNIYSPVRQKKVIQKDGEIGSLTAGQSLMTYGTVYGAGKGGNTWSEYTEVNLEGGAIVYEVYGGGQAGKVHNAESIHKFIKDNKPDKWAEDYLIIEKRGQPFTNQDWKKAWTLGGGLDSESWDDSWPGEDGKYSPADGHAYWENTYTNLANPLVREAEMDDRDFSGLTDNDKKLVQNRYCSNVIIEKGAYVSNYAYGGGYGVEAVVAGTTYIALLGGEVNKDIYAAGTSGSVEDLHGADVFDGEHNAAGFMASANAYIKGGTVRNVYGGGWRGNVGKHIKKVNTVESDALISEVANNNDDRLGETHVVIGDLNGVSHTDGIPSITRNVYGGGEGGAIFGHAYVKINKGYIGYRYNKDGIDNQNTTDIDEKYVPELDDKVEGDKLLDASGNVFGGGYVANSYVDHSHVEVLGGIIRGSLYGGGEIGPIGRGTVKADAAAPEGTIRNADAKIYKPGSTEVIMWDGHVMRDVFGGGRGYDNWNGEGYMTDEEKETMDKSSKGYVFGSTDVHIRGGEIGTEANVLKGFGNVFGGGNEGFVYSGIGTKPEGGEYYIDNSSNTSELSKDCRISVEPYCKVIDEDGITIGSTTHAKGKYLTVEELNKLRSRKHQASEWAKLDTRGIIIHNALFAGGNITEGSDKLFANTVTVYGNAAASLRDVYNFDLITLGTEDMGGIYGDGNLTLVDGFRELHIDNYGTDYYSLDPTMEITAFEETLTPRQQAYYKLKYVPKVPHTYEYYESRVLHDYPANDPNAVTYKRGQKISKTDWETLATSFSDDEKMNWSPGIKHYKEEDQIEEGEYNLMDGNENSGEKSKWKKWGVTSKYAGRPMNTIQRADFCGVFGSRLVLKGAQDRAPQVNGGVDYNNYTINRVKEVSLNKRDTKAGDPEGDKDYVHGNYFGIYSSVKFLGNLTSDVAFDADDAVRETDTNNEELKGEGYGSTTYYAWKSARPQNKYRNNGISHNKVALASGVYLELKREEGEIAGKDDWGYITGVIELDLINVMPGMGGGYVYAKNEHGTKTKASSTNKVSLLDYNTTAKTYRQYNYSESALELIETSGNFVHNTKQIVDDCYPNGGIYSDGYVASPAHYWFIRGNIYVYDQYISAFTGSANATAEKQEIPLTITAASNGRMKLTEVKPNYYAYYDKNGFKMGSMSGGVNADTLFVANNITYKLNQPISYWEYQLLGEGDKAKFVDQTYVVIEDCKIGETEYKKGSVMLWNEYNTLKSTNPKVKYMEDKVEKGDGDFNYFFRSSNNLSHENGYILTYDVNNPMVWNNYYTLTANPNQTNKLNTEQFFEKNPDDSYKVNQSLYTEGPTYTLNGDNDGVFAQQDYKRGNIIYGSMVTNYNSTVFNKLSDEAIIKSQAAVEQAYVVKEDYTLKDNDGNVVQELTAGTPVYKSKYEHYKQNDGAVEQDLWTGKLATATDPAKVCTSLLEFTTTDYVWAGQVLSSADIDELVSKVIEKNHYTDDPVDQANTAEKKARDFLKSYLDDAYYCTKDGKYGGIFFTHGQAYRAIDTWCSMPESERANFTFNYDALDLLIDKDYGGDMELYDGKGHSNVLNPKVYSASTPIDYQAEFIGEENTPVDPETGKKIIKYIPKTGSAVTIKEGDPWLSRTAYEAIPNEKHHYSPITVTAPGDYYMVKTAFLNGDIPYAAGQQIDKDTYEALSQSDKDNKIDVYTFVLPTEENAGSARTNPQKVDSESNPVVDENGNPVYEPITYYYCRNSYYVNEKGEGVAVTAIADEPPTYNSGDLVPQGVLISSGQYNQLKNFQKGFAIHGTSPTEVSTLYVSNESDINDLSTEKIITVIYQYEYEESDESGLNVTPVSERHIVNIHINFKSGVPIIGDINKPDLVLPGTTIGMNIPSVTQGAYRVTESGWEIFSNGDDAATHYNGVPFVNNETPLYWYQDDYWIAYYAKTSLGKTYSTPVQLSVGNYHDLKKVMDDKDHHYYIDHQDAEMPKIYINDYTTDDPATSQNGLDLLKNLIDLSYVKKTYSTVDGHLVPNRISGGSLNGHIPMEPRRLGGNSLEFFLRTDLDYVPTTAPDPENEGQTITTPWTPIANNDNEGECFSATLHGDGHTISGLDHSLINHLCGHIYNLGVSGSFTSSGIAEWGDGYIENCWIKTTSSPAANTHPLFGDPRADAYQVVNCYYLENDDATGKYTPFSAEGKNMAVKKPASAFYNGEVAYNLNGFYLNKRYYTGTNTNEPDKPTDQDQKLTSGSWYVENRFSDGDFIFANGTIPGSVDERAELDDKGEPKVDEHGNLIYHPKWPDDYIFFGQALNYNQVEGLTHQEVPSAITSDNRVYRAPAYYGDSKMSVAHFNPNAIFSVAGHEGMTAIDFSGCNDAGNFQLGAVAATESQPAKFYPPLLDDDGITGFTNVDLTRNLLVYTGNNITTATTVEGALAYESYSETHDKYHTVAKALNFTPSISLIKGHWVKKSGTGYQATRDQYLMDKEDFNAPIPYTFGSTNRMWYQRMPDNYVDIAWSSGENPVRTTTGWEGISLPFKAEIVTTDVKGEITHFYNDGANWKGHEYWLRQYKGGSKKNDAIFEALFNKPEKADGEKIYTNSFLWDFYYSFNSYDDKNLDKYPEGDATPQTYYKPDGDGVVNTYANYPRLANGTPYIIGFPGERYYEFDLSGKFEAKTAKATVPAKLDAQIITFASATGISIDVSDTELKTGGTAATAKGFVFMPNYSSKAIDSGAGYVLNTAGSSYDVTTASTKTVPFRPYFTGGYAEAREETRSIVFSEEQTQLEGEDDKPKKEEIGGTLDIYAKRKKIVVASTLSYTTDVRIVTPAGITVCAFAVEPGKTIEVRPDFSGMYIVHTLDGKYIKKVAVKK